MTNGSLMKVKSIAECSPWSILQYFWPALSDNWSWKLICCLFESGRFGKVLPYMETKTNGGALRSTMMPIDKFSCLVWVMILLSHDNDPRWLGKCHHMTQRNDWWKNEPVSSEDTSWHVHPSKTRIRLRNHSVWSVLDGCSICSQWLNVSSKHKTKILIRLYGCTYWFGSSLYAHTNFYHMRDIGSLMMKTKYGTMKLIMIFVLDFCMLHLS